MSAKRFAFIHNNISFDYSGDRPQRWKHERFAAFRDIFEEFNTCCSSVLQPNDYLTIDETLYSCRNQIIFNQYNKRNPIGLGFCINQSMLSDTLIHSRLLCILVNQLIILGLIIFKELFPP